MNHGHHQTRLCARLFTASKLFTSTGYIRHNGSNQYKLMLSPQLKPRDSLHTDSAARTNWTLLAPVIKIGLVRTNFKKPRLQFGNVCDTQTYFTGLVVNQRTFFRFLYRSMVSKKVENFKIKGLVSAPCTPFKENGDINCELIPDYVQHFVDYGIPNAFVTGTTGEGNCMTLSERKSVTEAWIQAAKGRLTSVIVHIGTGNLRDSQELARHAESVGADAISCVAPTYHKPENLEQYVYYMRDVAASAPDTPFFLYDIDFFTGVPYTAAEFFSVAHKHIPTLKGVKHTSPNIVSMANILAQHGDKYQVMIGSDEYFLECMALGIDITICSTYLGNVHNRMKEAFQRGDIETARQEQKRAVEFHNLRRKHDFGVPGFAKAVLRGLGLAVGDPRCPHKPIEDDLVTTLRKEMTSIGFNEWGMSK